MTIRALQAAACIVLAGASCFAGVVVGQKLPSITVTDKGVMVPRTKVQNGKMVLDGKDISYAPWKLEDGSGRVRTIYHLAGRIGIDDKNKDFIDALIAAKLPEYLPDSPYKTITILNLDDTFMGTHGIASGKFETSQRNFPHAIYVADEKSVAQTAWGLKRKESAVIVLDKDGTVLFFKEGKLSPEDVAKAVGIIKAKVQ